MSHVRQAVSYNGNRAFWITHGSSTPCADANLTSTKFHDAKPSKNVEFSYMVSLSRRQRYAKRSMGSLSVPLRPPTLNNDDCCISVHQRNNAVLHNCTISVPILAVLQSAGMPIPQISVHCAATNTHQAGDPKLLLAWLDERLRLSPKQRARMPANPGSDIYMTGQARNLAV